MIGDSLTYQYGYGAARMAARLAGLGYTDIRVDGHTGRTLTHDQATAPGSLSLIRTWRTAGFDPYTYVIALGTNNKDGTSTYWSAEMTRVVSAIGPGHRIIWVGLGFRPPGDPRVIAFNTNAAYLAAIDGIEIAEWNSYVHGFDQTGLWSPNGIVHMTQAGYRIRNGYIAGLVGPR